MRRHALAGPIPVFSCFFADSESSIPGLTISSTHTSSFPRRMFAPGVFNLCFTHPESRGGRSAERRIFLSLSRLIGASELRGCGAARTLRLRERTLAFRRSTVAVFSRARAVLLRHWRRIERTKSRTTRDEPFNPPAAGRHSPLRASFSQAIETDNSFGGRARPSTLPSTLGFGQTGRGRHA